jgi:hypothetical protein
VDPVKFGSGHIANCLDVISERLFRFVGQLRECIERNVTSDFQTYQGLNVSLLRFSHAGRYRSRRLTKRDPSAANCDNSLALSQAPSRSGSTLAGSPPSRPSRGADAGYGVNLIVQGSSTCQGVPIGLTFYNGGTGDKPNAAGV